MAGAEPVPSAPPSAAGDAVAAGKYLADAAHCSACHTSRADRPYAGNLPMGSPFGTMFTSNITPDPATGIGRWTEQQFTAALRDGKGSHGEYLYPAMPYTSFTKVSDADIHALWAYFRTVKPITEKTRKNEMRFPFNVRTGIGAWQAVFFKKGRYVDDASQPAEWNRGAYLVEGLGHCAACHSPKNMAMADKKGHALQGAELDHWFAPDISGGRYSGIKDWSQAQIVTYLRTGHNAQNVAAVGPMLQTIAQGTAKLADSDLQAIAIYLKNQGSSGEARLPKNDNQWNAERKEAGGTVYADHCASCHGSDGQGLDGLAPALAGNTSVTSKGPETVVRSVLEGFAPQGRWGVMPSFNETLSAQEVSDVANYVRIAWGTGNGPANATTSMVNRMRIDGVQVAQGVRSALVCPSAPTDALDPDTLRDVAVLAKNPATADAAAGRLVGQYHARHAAVVGSQAVTALSGAYCRAVMASAPGSYAEKQQRFVTFMARVAEANAKIR